MESIPVSPLLSGVVGFVAFVLPPLTYLCLFVTFAVLVYYIIAKIGDYLMDYGLTPPWSPYVRDEDYRNGFIAGRWDAPRCIPEDLSEAQTYAWARGYDDGQQVYAKDPLGPMGGRAGERIMRQQLHDAELAGDTEAQEELKGLLTQTRRALRERKN